MNEKYPSETSDMYLRLGIERNSSYEEIKEAYRKAALHWHPDRNDDKERAHLEFIAVSEAFEILSKELNKSKPTEDNDYNPYEPEGSDKENTYEYYDELFRKIFKDCKFYRDASPQIRTIIEIFKQFGRL